MTVPSPLRQYKGKLGNAASLALMEAPHASVQAVLDDAATAAMSALMVEAGGPVFDEASFERLRDHVAGHAADQTARIIADVVRILQAAREVRRRLDELHGAALADVRTDVAQQIGRLVFPGFITATGAARLPDVERYLRGAAWRLERLHRAAAVDRDRMREVHELEDPYRRRAGGAATRRGGRRAGRCPVAARGAADQLLRPGRRDARPGIGEEGPAHPRRSRPLTTNDPPRVDAGRSIASDRRGDHALFCGLKVSRG